MALRRYCLHFVGLLIACSGQASSETQDFDFGGVRQIKARVEHDGGGYTCDIAFRPVACFDGGTNRKINLTKSRGYAIRAMAKAAGINLGTVRATKLRVSQPLTVDVDRATIQYRADGLELLKAAVEPKNPDSLPPGKQRNEDNAAELISADEAGARTLLSCFGDLSSTLQELEQALNGELASLKAGESLADSVADLEERAVSAFKRLEVETSGERLLLAIEKNDLIAEIQEKRREFMKRLEAAYTALNTSEARIHNYE